MINLVPPKAKKDIILEYWVRVLSVWATLGTATALLIAIILFPVFVLVETQISVYRESANQASQKIATFENVSLQLARASTQAQIIMASDENQSLSELVYLFGSLEGQGITLSQVNISRSLNGVAPVSLVGIADSRLALSNFRDRLLAHEAIESVDFPISNLARDRDIPFNITVTMVNKAGS